MKLFLGTLMFWGNLENGDTRWKLFVSHSGDTDATKRCTYAQVTPVWTKIFEWILIQLSKSVQECDKAQHTTCLTQKQIYFSKSRKNSVIKLRCVNCFGLENFCNLNAILSRRKVIQGKLARRVEDCSIEK